MANRNFYRELSVRFFCWFLDFYVVLDRDLVINCGNQDIESKWIQFYFLSRSDSILPGREKTHDA